MMKRTRVMMKRREEYLEGDVQYVNDRTSQRIKYSLHLTWLCAGLRCEHETNYTEVELRHWLNTIPRHRNQSQKPFVNERYDLTTLTIPGIRVKALKKNFRKGKIPLLNGEM